MAKVTCSTSGTPPLIGRWIKDSREWNVMQLTFHSINRTDKGPYMFILRNGVQCKEAVKSVSLTVNRKYVYIIICINHASVIISLA